MKTLGNILEAVYTVFAQALCEFIWCTGKVFLFLTLLCIGYILIFGENNMDADSQVMNIISSTYRLIYMGLVELNITPPEWVTHVLTGM